MLVVYMAFQAPEMVIGITAVMVPLFTFLLLHHSNVGAIRTTSATEEVYNLVLAGH